jgi:hypothetical protein
MTSFEAQLYKCFNELYANKKIAALAYKLPMVRYHRQGFDVYSDSRHYEYYSAFECKSHEAKEGQPLYFSAHFHHVNGIHQLTHENQILLQTGRVGFLAVELKNHDGNRKSAFLIPWRVVYQRFTRGENGLPLSLITSYIELEYAKQGYHMTEDNLIAYKKEISGMAKAFSLKWRR